MNSKKLLEFDLEKIVHKDKFDLGKKSKEEWITHINETIKLLETITPKIYSKIKKYIKKIIPYGYIKGVQKSLSYVDMPGTLYISYQDNPVTQAEAIVHETCHTILFIFSKNDSGMLNEYIPKYYSAVQDMPRELQNCFLAAHAFVHVLEFYIELIKNQKKYEKEFILTIFSTYIKTSSLLTVIKDNAEFTNKGEKLFNDMKKNFETSEKQIKSLKKRFKDEFRTSQEKQIIHFEKVTQEFENIIF